MNHPPTLTLSCFSGNIATADATLRSGRGIVGRFIIDLNESAPGMVGSSSTREVGRALREAAGCAVSFVTTAMKQKIAASLTADGLPLPDYGEFTFGGSANMLMAAAHASTATYVRIDPGCVIPQNLEEILRVHKQIIRSGEADAVCGQYAAKGRTLALRVDAAYDVDGLVAMVEDLGGIAVVQGPCSGALLTLRPANVPPAPACRLGVWRSDDGIPFRNRFRFNADCRVDRSFNVGVVRSGAAYFSSVARGVFVGRRVSGESLVSARAFVQQFEECLPNLVSCELPSCLLPDHEVAALETDLMNHFKLIDAWDRVLERSAEILNQEMPGAVS